jgi:hypothetical protein
MQGKNSTGSTNSSKTVQEVQTAPKRVKNNRVGIKHF